MNTRKMKHSRQPIVDLELPCRLPVIMEAAAEASAAKQKYVASSQELASAISSLENALVAFVGREEGIKVLPLAPAAAAHRSAGQTFCAGPLYAGSGFRSDSGASGGRTRCKPRFQRCDEVVEECGNSAQTLYIVGLR